MDNGDVRDFKVAISDEYPDVMYRAFRGKVQPVITWGTIEDRNAKVSYPITEFPVENNSHVTRVVAPNHLPIHSGDEIIGITPLFNANYNFREMDLRIYSTRHPSYANSTSEQEHVEGILMYRNGKLYGESFRFLPNGTGGFSCLLRGDKPYVEKDELVGLALECFGLL